MKRGRVAARNETEVEDTLEREDDAGASYWGSPVFAHAAHLHSQVSSG